MKWMRFAAPAAAGCQQVECLGQYRHGGGERFEEALQHFDAGRMRIVRRIEQRDEWTRVEQDHLPCLRAMAERTADFASRAAARA